MPRFDLHTKGGCGARPDGRFVVLAAGVGKAP